MFLEQNNEKIAVIYNNYYMRGKRWKLMLPLRFYNTA